MCEKVMLHVGARVVRWDPVSTVMRIPRLVDHLMEVDNKALQVVVVYADDVDVAIHTTKGGGAAVLAEVNAHCTAGKSTGVCLLMTAGLIKGESVLCALARAVGAHVHLSPSGQDVLDCLLAHRPGDDAANAVNLGETTGRCGTDIRGGLLAIENGLLSMDVRGDDGEDDDPFIEFTTSSAADAGARATPWQARTAMEVALFEWRGRDAMDGRLAHLASVLGEALSNRCAP